MTFDFHPASFFPDLSSPSVMPSPLSFLRRRGLLRAAKYGLAATVTLPPAAVGLWYAAVADERQRVLVGRIASSMPDILSGGQPSRFLRTVATGISISVDYKMLSLRWGREDEERDADGYDAALRAAHRRTADKILATCLHNGGLYIKFGQGVLAMNNVLPKEYLETLRVAAAVAVDLGDVDVVEAGEVSGAALAVLGLLEEVELSLQPPLQLVEQPTVGEGGEDDLDHVQNPGNGRHVAVVPLPQVNVLHL